MPLLLTNFERAIESLRRALAQPKDEFTRDAAIKRFEYTYELAWKLIQRALVVEMGLSEVSGLPKREMYRIAARHDLIEDPAAWFRFYEARNATSHVSNEVSAEAAYEAATDFPEAASVTLAKLDRFRAS